MNGMTGPSAYSNDPFSGLNGDSSNNNSTNNSGINPAPFSGAAAAVGGGFTNNSYNSNMNQYNNAVTAGGMSYSNPNNNAGQYNNNMQSGAFMTGGIMTNNNQKNNSNDDDDFGDFASASTSEQMNLPPPNNNVNAFPNNNNFPQQSPMPIVPQQQQKNNFYPPPQSQTPYPAMGAQTNYNPNVGMMNNSGTTAAAIPTPYYNQSNHVPAVALYNYNSYGGGTGPTSSMEPQQQQQFPQQQQQPFYPQQQQPQFQQPSYQSHPPYPQALQQQPQPPMYQHQQQQTRPEQFPVNQPNQYSSGPYNTMPQQHEQQNQDYPLQTGSQPNTNMIPPPRPTQVTISMGNENSSQFPPPPIQQIHEPEFAAGQQLSTINSKSSVVSALTIETSLSQVFESSNQPPNNAQVASQPPQQQQPFPGNTFNNNYHENSNNDNNYAANRFSNTRTMSEVSALSGENDGIVNNDTFAAAQQPGINQNNEMTQNNTATNQPQSATTASGYEDAFAGLEPAHTDWTPVVPTGSLSVVKDDSEPTTEPGHQNGGSGEDDDFGDFIEADDSAVPNNPPLMSNNITTTNSNNNNVTFDDDDDEFGDFAGSGDGSNDIAVQQQPPPSSQDPSLDPSSWNTVSIDGRVQDGLFLDGERPAATTTTGPQSSIPAVMGPNQYNLNNNPGLSIGGGTGGEMFSNHSVASVPTASMVQALVGTAADESSAPAGLLASNPNNPTNNNNNEILSNENNEADDDDDFGDFTGSVNQQATETSPPSQPTTSTGIGEDGLGPTAGIKSTEPNLGRIGETTNSTAFGTNNANPATVVGGLSASDSVDEYDDPFAHLDGGPREVAPPQLGAPNTLALNEDGGGGGDDDDDDHDDDDFGDFGSAPQQQTPTDVPVVEASAEDSAFAPLSDATGVQVAVVGGGNHDDDDDDDFGDFGSAQQPMTGTTSTEMLSESVKNQPTVKGEENDDFGDFGYSVQQHTTPETTIFDTNNGREQEEDDFGDFGSAQQGQPKPASETNNNVVESAANNVGQEDDDDDFGDFGSALKSDDEAAATNISSQKAESSIGGQFDTGGSNFGGAGSKEVEGVSASDPDKSLAPKTSYEGYQDDDFDNFGSAQSAGAVSDDDFGDFGSAQSNDGMEEFENPASSQVNATSLGAATAEVSEKAAVENSTDYLDFGISGAVDFGPVASNTFESKEQSLPTTNGEQIDAVSTSEDDFGGFGSASPGNQESCDENSTSKNNVVNSSAAEASAGDDDDFGDFGSAAVDSHPQDTVVDELVDRKESATAADDDDFGDFGSANLEDTAQSHPSMESKPNAENFTSDGDEFVSAPQFSDGITDVTNENSQGEPVGAMDEDFGNFSSAPDDTPSVPEPQVNDETSVNVAGKAPDGPVVSDFDDDFGDFGSAPNEQASEANIQNPSTHIEEKMESTTSVPDKNDVDDDGFDDFGSAAAFDSAEVGTVNQNNVTEGKTETYPEDDDFGDFGSAEVSEKLDHSDPNSSNDATEENSTRLVGSGTSEEEVITKSEANTADDDDFGDFGSAEVIHQDNEKKNTADDDVDDFGDFGSAPETVTNTTNDQSGAAQSNEDDDFGDFDSAPGEKQDAGNTAAMPENHQQQGIQQSVTQASLSPQLPSVPIESNLLLKLTKMSFEKMFGHHLTEMKQQTEDESKMSGRKTMTIDSFLHSLGGKEDESGRTCEKVRRELHDLLLQMNRPSTETNNEVVLLYPDRPTNPYLYPAWHGFRASSLYRGAFQQQQQHQLAASPQQEEEAANNQRRPENRNLPEVLDVKLMTPDEVAPDRASPVSDKPVLPPQSSQGTVVDIPPLPLNAKTKSASK